MSKCGEGKHSYTVDEDVMGTATMGDIVEVPFEVSSDPRTHLVHPPKVKTAVTLSAA